MKTDSQCCSPHSIYHDYATWVISKQLLSARTESLLSAIFTLKNPKFFPSRNPGTHLWRYVLSWEATVLCPHSSTLPSDVYMKRLRNNTYTMLWICLPGKLLPIIYPMSNNISTSSAVPEMLIQIMIQLQGSGLAASPGSGFAIGL